MTTLWIVFLTPVVVFVLYICLKLARCIQELHTNIAALKNIPAEPRHWIFGNAHEITCWSSFLKRMQTLYVDKGEKWYKFWLFNLPVVMVTHPDTAKEILRSSEPKSHGILGYGGLMPWLGHSLLISNGTKWERNRRLLTPAFHFDILKPYVKIVNQVADVFNNKLSKAAEESKSVDIFCQAGLATLDSLLQCALSYKGNVQELGETHPYVTAVKKLCHLLVERTCTPLHLSDFIYKLSANGREFYKNCDFVHTFSGNIITERKKILKENPNVLEKRHLDFLDILLTAKDGDGVGLSDEEIRDEVDTFMFAGHDTTATVIGWSMYALGKNPEQQAKVYDEVKEVLGQRQSVGWEDLSKLKYLTCFLKEVMRLYTPVPVASRMVSKPITIEGVTIPKGTYIDLGFYHIHHNPDVWPDPWEFKPERFENEDILKRDPYSFVPFSAGPRNCIGQNFAQNEDKIFVARIINRFEVSIDPQTDNDPHFEAVLRTKGGLHIRFKDRK